MIVVVSRDLMIVTAVILSWLMARPVTIAPIVVSKLNTAAQLVFAALVLGSKSLEIDVAAIMPAAQIIVAALTLASMGAYLALWLRHMAG